MHHALVDTSIGTVHGVHGEITPCHTKCNIIIVDIATLCHDCVNVASFAEICGRTKAELP